MSLRGARPVPLSVGVECWHNCSRKKAHGRLEHPTTTARPAAGSLGRRIDSPLQL